MEKKFLSLALQEIAYGLNERLRLLVHYHVPRFLDRYAA